jgi:cytochrome c oxidase assembly protein subunit 15
MRLRLLRHGTTCAILLAIFVVMLGAYTRLTDAGSGCPDWPGCYGKMVLPHAKSALQEAQLIYPENVIEENKAWTEMAHRYAAGTLAMLIVGITILFYTSNRQKSPLRRRRDKYWKIQSSNDANFLETPSLSSRTSPTTWSILPALLVGLITFQAALGMWTVTLKLLPIVVMGHLLGGITIFATLCYFRWQLSAIQPLAHPHWCRYATLGIVIVFLQIALGGWVSSNYAGIACISFPRCNSEWLPHFSWIKAFNVFSSLGLNYQGGLLDNAARVTIQWVHRLGALVTFMYLVIFSNIILLRISTRSIRLIAMLILLLVVIQVTLGVLNVVYLLPLSVAVAHNGIAALLLGATASLRYLLSKKGTSYDNVR